MADERPMNEKATWQKSQWIGVICTVIGVFIGRAFAHGVSLDTKVRLLSGGVVGAILGYLVNRAAKRRGQEKLGRIALLCCTGAGAALGFILACPVALIFYFIIRSRESSSGSTEGARTNRGDGVHSEHKRGTKSWSTQFGDHQIKVSNHTTWLPPRTWETIEIDGVERVRQQGSIMLRLSSTMYCNIETDSGPTLIEVRIAQLVGSLHAGCHIIANGTVIGGDLRGKLNYQEPQAWLEVQNAGVWNFLLKRGIGTMGIPFALITTMSNRTMHGPEMLIGFVTSAIMFGTTMGYFFWRSGKDSYLAALKAKAEAMASSATGSDDGLPRN
jgi:hypothetical protein